jgi:hypothetical protein
LDQSENLEADIVALVGTFMLDHEFQLPIDVTRADLLRVRGGNVSGYCDDGAGARRTVLWLINNVRPAVSRLVGAGRLTDVLEALGIDQLVQVMSTECSSSNDDEGSIN